MLGTDEFGTAGAVRNASLSLRCARDRTMTVHAAEAMMDACNTALRLGAPAEIRVGVQMVAQGIERAANKAKYDLALTGRAPR